MEFRESRMQASRTPPSFTRKRQKIWEYNLFFLESSFNPPATSVEPGSAVPLSAVEPCAVSTISTARPSGTAKYTMAPVAEKPDAVSMVSQAETEPSSTALSNGIPRTHRSEKTCLGAPQPSQGLFRQQLLLLQNQIPRRSATALLLTSHSPFGKWTRHGEYRYARGSCNYLSGSCDY